MTEKPNSKENMRELWDRIVECLSSTLTTHKTQGIMSVINLHSINTYSHNINDVDIRISRKDSPLPEVQMIVKFFPEKYEIRSTFPISPGYKSQTFRFTVSGGRISLSEGATPLPDDGEDITQVVCRRLLEPVLASFI